MLGETARVEKKNVAVMLEPQALAIAAAAAQVGAGGRQRWRPSFSMLSL